MNIHQALERADKFLKKKHIPSSMLDSEILMLKVINKDKKFLILNSKKNLSKKILSNFSDLIKKRSRGEPIAYLTNKKFFWKDEFIIKKKILIPRPDTEVLVEETLKLTKKNSKMNILDIGVGSGCILLSILKERKNFFGVGIDISKKCIDISKTNAFKLKISNRVKLLKSNVDNFNYGKYDLIVSNPPYINTLNLKCLERDIYNFEPKIALDGGLDGLNKIKKVIEKSSKLLKKKGIFILEIGFDQKNRVINLLKDKGFYIKKTVKDLAKNDRCIISLKI